MAKKTVSKKTAIAKIVQSFRRIFKAIHQYSEEVLKEFGVTGPQLWLLKTLREEGGTSVGELSEKMYLHISTVSGIIDRLETKGYVVRKREAPDRRVVTVHLTAAGKRIVDRAPEPSQGKLLYSLQTLSEKEVLEMHDALQKIVRLMEVEQIEATFFFSEE
ncbi:MAG: MarR family transcriptional regulator [Candidatus Manganitrophus sp.]|nr:MarR family transcriptional regulator [Candidatus Manganitrophus sp.]MDC4223013.1 MarR family transcriptional regulator [Candidatus Manganitrophus sp.]WDT71369.1 MAG: MarR family transcriptional regulator [Candidatus Manganitrophus sp.]WDT76374.1 MAG: MarR family transcriptional regulator [Candidatus Manganitrophus sp.]WDT81305.1 MAG: MarR family transcriptional regulator [Candidatus Manganitrophus sp.]